MDIKAAIQLLFVPPQPLSVETIQEFADIEEGDHLFYKIPFGMNDHFYVVSILGDDKIEVYGRFCKNNDDPLVKQQIFSKTPPSASSLKLEKRVLNLATLEKHRLKRQLHKSTDIVKEKQRIIKYKRTKTLYGFLNNNSEHFVTFVKTINAKCKVAEEFKKASIKHVSAQVLQHCDIKGLHHSIEIVPVAMKNGKLAALTAFLQKIVKAAAVQSTTSAAESGSIQIAKKAANVALKKNFKQTVVVQIAFEGVIYTVCITAGFYKHISGHMDKDEFKDYIVKRLTTTAGSLVGGICGSLTGVAAGAAIGSGVPRIGTAIGSTVGGFVGVVGGGLGGTALGRVTGNCINWLRHR